MATGVVDSVGAALGDSFSVGWFGLFEVGAAGTVISGAIAEQDATVLLGVRVASGAIELVRPTGGPLVVDGLWELYDPEVPHAFVVTYDRATSSLSVFVDGRLIGTSTLGVASPAEDVSTIRVGGGAAFATSDVLLFGGSLEPSAAIDVSNAMARDNGGWAFAPG